MSPFGSFRVRLTVPHHPEPPPPPPPPPDEPPPDDPPPLSELLPPLDPGGVAAEDMVLDRLSPSLSAKEVTLPVLWLSPVYQDATAAPTPAAASTPVNFLAQLFSTSSAMA